MSQLADRKGIRSTCFIYEMSKLIVVSRTSMSEMVLILRQLQPAGIIEGRILGEQNVD